MRIPWTGYVLRVHWHSSRCICDDYYLSEGMYPPISSHKGQSKNQCCFLERQYSRMPVLAWKMKSHNLFLFDLVSVNKLVFQFVWTQQLLSLNWTLVGTSTHLRENEIISSLISIFKNAWKFENKPKSMPASEKAIKSKWFKAVSFLSNANSLINWYFYFFLVELKETKKCLNESCSILIWLSAR